MKFYFVRHAQDDNRYRGGWSGLDLTPEGIIQAEKLAYYLKEKKKKYQANKIISSDLVRTKHTADIINERLKIDIEYSADWREINNGDLAGMENTVAEIRYPKLYFNTLRMNERYPNGESPVMFFNRIKKAFMHLCDSSIGTDNILLVTHAGVIISFTIL